jgi:hypothetical protein
MGQGVRLRVRRGCNGVRRSPRKELMPNTFGLKGRRWRGGTFVASKAGVWPETFAGRSSPATAHFGKRYGMVAQPVRATSPEPCARWRVPSLRPALRSPRRGRRRSDRRWGRTARGGSLVCRLPTIHPFVKSSVDQALTGLDMLSPGVKGSAATRIRHGRIAPGGRERSGRVCTRPYRRPHRDTSLSARRSRLATHFLSQSRVYIRKHGGRASGDRERACSPGIFGTAS